MAKVKVYNRMVPDDELPGHLDAMGVAKTVQVTALVSNPGGARPYGILVWVILTPDGKPANIIFPNKQAGKVELRTADVWWHLEPFDTAKHVLAVSKYEGS